MFLALTVGATDMAVLSRNDPYFLAIFFARRASNAGHLPIQLMRSSAGKEMIFGFLTGDIWLRTSISEPLCEKRIVAGDGDSYPVIVGFGLGDIVDGLWVDITATVSNTSLSSGTDEICADFRCANTLCT